MRSSLLESRPASGNSATRPSSTPGLQYSSMPTSMSARSPRQEFPAPNEGWLPLLLLAVAVYVVVYSVTAAIAVSHTSLLWIMTAVGLLSGLATSKVRQLPQALLHLGSCLIGGLLALVLTSVLAYQDSPLILLRSLRVVIFGGLSLANTAHSDMVFLFYLSFLCFFLGYFGSWLVYRAHLPWLVALVYVSILLVNLNYVVRRDLSFLIVVLVGALILLIARTHLAGQVTQWRHDGLSTDQVWLTTITMRFLRIASLFVLLILPLSWFLPMLNQPTSGVTFWNDLDNAWSNITHGHFSPDNPGGLLQPYQVPANFFGDHLTITGSVNLPSGPVLTYTSSSLTQGQYLEGFTFDLFDGHTWSASAGGSSNSYGANVILPPDLFIANSTQLDTSITILQPPGGNTYLFAPHQPSSFSVPVAVLSDGSGTVAAAWTQIAPLSVNEHYQVTSEVPSVSYTSLTEIPLPGVDARLWAEDTNYATLRQNYIEIPNDLSPQVQATLHAWTHGAQSAYGAALDLQAHLSDGSIFTYSIQNPPVPSNIDAVDWLLQTHRGYCTYYATAMTIMARLLGLPARIVNGFSQGQYNGQKRIWTVAGNDAHSWVQIYFPGSGWLNFDPTPGFAVPNQPAAAPLPSSSPTPVTSSPTSTPTKTHSTHPLPTDPQPGPSAVQGDIFVQRLLLTFALLFLLGSLLALGLAIVRYRKSRRSNSSITALYARLCRVAGLVGAPPAPWQTPYEYTFALSRRFPDVAGALRRLADLFVRVRWASPHYAPVPAEEHALIQIWPRLRNAILRSPFRRRR